MNDRDLNMDRASLISGLRWGWLSRNEAYKMEGLPPVADGDVVDIDHIYRMDGMVKPSMPLPESPPPDDQPEALALWIRTIERDKQWCCVVQDAFRHGKRQGALAVIMTIGALAACSVVFWIGWMM